MDVPSLFIRHTIKHKSEGSLFTEGTFCDIIRYDYVDVHFHIVDGDGYFIGCMSDDIEHALL